MKNLNKKTEFDKHWEEVFQDAEMTPPDSVWSRIDSDLSKEEAGYFKRRAFMFKILAAASIAFALGIGVFSLSYYMGNQPDTPVAQSANQIEQHDDLNSTDNALLAQEQPNSNLNSFESDDNQELNLNNTLSETGKNSSFSNSITDQIGTEEISTNLQNDNLADNTIKNSDGMVIPLIDENDVNNQMSDQVNEEPAPVFASLNSLDPKGIYYVSDEDMIYEINHIYLIPFMPRGASKNRRQDEENNTGILMASVDFSAGQFDPNFQQGSSSFSVSNGSVVADARTEMTSFSNNKKFLKLRTESQETKADIAFSYGANIGFKLSNRFLLQTGLAYRKANATTSTRGYFESLETGTRIPIAPTNYVLNGFTSPQETDDPISLNNRYEFASVPLRAGYVILNKKINVTLLAGVTSEIFINNNISDGSGFLESLSSNEDYKKVYFNGLLGTMLGYSFAEKYMVTVEPSYRMAINSFTKDSFYLESYPSSFMLSFGVAYNFR